MTSREFIPALCNQEHWLQRTAETWSCVKLLSTKSAHPSFLEQIWNHGVSSYHVNSLHHFGSSIRSPAARLTVPLQPQPWTQSPSKSLRGPRKVNSLMPEFFRESVVRWLQPNYINTNQSLDPVKEVSDILALKQQRFLMYVMQYQYCMHPCLCVTSNNSRDLTAWAETWVTMPSASSHCGLKAGSTELHSLGWGLASFYCGFVACLLEHTCGTVLTQGWWQQGNALQLPEPKT